MRFGHSRGMMVRMSILPNSWAKDGSSVPSMLSPTEAGCGKLYEERESFGGPSSHVLCKWQPATPSLKFSCERAS
jgi:hypothetical protein